MDDDAKFDTIDDIVDYVKSGNFFGMVAIGLNEETSHNMIFQFRPSDVSLEEAISWAMTSFLGGVTSLIGPAETTRLMKESVARVKEMMAYIREDLNVNKTLQ